MDNNFIYGIAKLEVGSVGANNAITYAEIGYIEKGSFQWGGSAPESVDVEAEQVPSAPVLILRQKNGTIAPQFNLIQLDVNNLKADEQQQDMERPERSGGPDRPGKDHYAERCGDQYCQRRDPG